ncbi:aspartate kinase [Trichothermofontia sichuanensis B231]|uniref:aspartate kinase n=1 Tax=Trichothermofontia sichuanensis TaxID=3045816 RepID=UPI0022485FC7|nr:aspartate kinase [Trichothermofontia sichuanensis]UZQ55604.1 aspartate kinase [Trichothermofontia sichuanensis B231]
MGLIVQKYGGTSVGTVERIQAVAQRVQATVNQGHGVVVVVSAMGKTTDGLVQLAHEITANPSRREMDMLLATGEQVSIALVSMALQELGQPAISMTGAQVGIITEAIHSRARILQIATDRIERHLKDGKVVVIAGFQGISSIEDLEITTLGRGGSDTSAVALAAALQADCCEIYTDVPGILTTDPRLVPEAQLMAEITCDEMLELASLGAKVLHPRAVEIARNYGVMLVVRSSWTDDPGTRVLAPAYQPRRIEGLEIVHPVDCVEYDRDQARIALLRVPDQPGVAARLFGEIASQDLDVDLIIQSIHEGNTNDIAFTVVQASLLRAEAVAEALIPTLAGEGAREGACEVMIDRAIAKVSIAGAGMIGRPGIAAQMFSTLAAAGINIQMISTSEVKVSCVVAADDCDRAVEALCQAFEVGSQPAAKAIGPVSDVPPVRGVALDLNQAQLAIRSIPDRPGMAAKVFQLLAAHQISVDMIIQSQRCRVIDGVTTRDIAFTVAEGDARQAQACLQAAAGELGFREVVVNTAIAKVSAVGAGMVGRPGVAACMFRALAAEQINIQMITTSEIKVSCVVAQAEGVRALQAIHRAFKLEAAGTRVAREAAIGASPG